MVEQEIAMSGPAVPSALRRGVVAATAALCALAAGVSVGVAAGLAGPASATTAAEPQLYLVTLEGGGISDYRGRLSAASYRELLRGEQDVALAAVGVGGPVYRWTTALNGVTVRLTAEQASRLAVVPNVELVERNDVR